MSRDNITFWIRAVFFAAVLVVLQCAGLDPIAGTVTQSGNGIVCGVVVDSGTLVPNARVRLIPEQYDPLADPPLPDALADTTDQTGAFSISAPRSRNYNVLVEHTGKNALRWNVSFATGDTQSTGLMKLTFPGAIKVIVPDTADAVPAYVYLPGTTFFALVQGDTALIGNVPAGIIPKMSYRRAAAGAESRVIKTDIFVTSGDTTALVDYSTWRYSKKLYLNTTASGANVAGNVTDFPVLVRLTSSNFDFRQAGARGEDVRFAKSDGTPLPFEIERWDAVNGTAEVWVKVDTVYGNDSTQLITMYWGNPSASDKSDGAAVFDTASGFAAVWHLNTGCSDITAGEHDGTNFGTTDTVGIIGDAKKFNGSSYIQVPGLLGTPQSITLSAWVHLDSTTSFSQDIVSLGDAVALRADRVAGPYYGTEGFFCSKVSASDTSFVFTSTGVFIAKTGWRYLTYTVDGTRHVQSVYIDGIFHCSTNDTAPINYSGLGPNTFLGAHGNKKTASYALGCIDEARVCRVTRSADWIKLCYMNQKQQDVLVRW